MRPLFFKVNMDKYKILLRSQDNKVLLSDNEEGFKDLPTLTRREYLKIRRSNDEVFELLGIHGDHLTKPLGVMCYSATPDLTLHILTLRVIHHSQYFIFNDIGKLTDPKFYADEQIIERKLGASIVDTHLPDFIQHLA